MTLFSRIFTGLGAFLIVMGIVYGLVTGDCEGTTEMLTVAGGGLLIGVYLARTVAAGPGGGGRAGGQAADRSATANRTCRPRSGRWCSPLSTIGIVLGSVGTALGAGRGRGRPGRLARRLEP